MEFNPPESDRMQMRRNPVKTAGHARFRRSLGKSLIYCETCLQTACRCSSGISMATLTSSSQTQAQAQRSDLDLFRVCLNCPLDNDGSCSSCSAISLSVAPLDLDRSTLMMTGGPSFRATETHGRDEGSVYDGRRMAGSTDIFKKPSTTTAMSMPGAEESTVYNGKIGCLLSVGNQSGINPTGIAASSIADASNEAIFDESICTGGLISFGKLPSHASSPAIHIQMMGAPTKEGAEIICGRPDRPKRSCQGDITEDASNSNLAPEKDMRFRSAAVVVSTSVPEHSMHSSKESWDPTVLCQEASMSSRLLEPALPRPSSSLRHKQRKTETIHMRVPAVNSEESGLPPDGYKWWKCGQKDIKGSPYPRNYYKCKTLRDCDAKKHVMRAVEEPSMLDITYKGKHSHAPALELNVATCATASASILPSASAVADIVPGVLPAAPREEPRTVKSADFIEYL